MEFQCTASTTVTEAARRSGYIMAMACERGGCGACKARLLSGEIHYQGQVSQIKRQEPVAGAELFELPCRALPKSDLVLEPLHPWRTINLTPLSALVRKK